MTRSVSTLAGEYPTRIQGGAIVSTYETAPGVQPVRIVTVRALRRRHKLGEDDEPRLYEDFFRDTTRGGTANTMQIAASAAGRVRQSSHR